MVNKTRSAIQNIHTDTSKGVFAGYNASNDYLNPANHPVTPLVEIVHEDLNKFWQRGVRIFAKLFTSYPGSQVKFLTVNSMISAAEKAGELTDGVTLVEGTSGNTGAEITKKRFAELYVKPDTTQGKIRYLQLLGAQVIITEGGVQKASKAGHEPGKLNLNQYRNEANPNVFQNIIGPQIWDQTNGLVNIFCAGLGSTGTMVGTSRYLKNKNPDLQSIGVIVEVDNEVPGVRTRKRLEEVSFDWESIVDNQQIVGAFDSYQTSLDLIRKSKLQAGPSAGFAFKGLMQYLTEIEASGELEGMLSRNPHHEVIAVFPIPDDPKLYLDEYFTILDASNFKEPRNL